jgi:hypothetical protein
MNLLPPQMLDDLAAERINERRRTSPRAPIPAPRSRNGRHHIAGALRHLADRLEQA